MLNPHLKPPCSDCRGLEEATTLPPETQDSRNSQALTAKSCTSPDQACTLTESSAGPPSCTEGISSGQGDHTHPRKARKSSRLPSEPQAKREHDGALKDTPTHPRKG